MYSYLVGLEAYILGEPSSNATYFLCLCPQILHEWTGSSEPLLLAFMESHELTQGAQWPSGRVLDSRPRGRGLESHRRHCVVSFSKTHLSLLSTGSTQEDPS